MTTTARRCAGCSGPLPEVADGDNQIKCQFCGLVNAVATGPSTPTIRIELGPRGPARPTNAFRLAGALGVFGLVLGLMGAAAGIYIAVREVTDPGSTNETTDRVTRSLSANGLLSAGVAPVDLKTTLGAGWRTVDVPAPASGWSTFDPVGELAWAQAIATAWQPDAQLTRIDVSKLTPGGRVDATAGDDSGAGYRFHSPAQEQAWRDAVRQGDRDPAIGHELMLKVFSSTVRALVSRGRPGAGEPVPTVVDSLALDTLLARAAGRRGFEATPFYDGYLIFNEREGWVWYLTGLGNQSSFPRVRARDAAVYPYR